MPFQIERIQSEHECERIRQEWLVLYGDIYPRNPFGAPFWNLHWWRHFSRKSIGVAHEFFLHTVRDEQGKLRGVAPWMIMHRPAVGPFRLRVLTPFGADQSITEIRGVICRSEDEAEVLAALREYLRTLQKPFDAIEWAGVRSLDALDTLETEGPLSFAKIGQCYVLTLPESWDAVRANVGSSMRKYLRRAGEKLDEIGKELQLTVISGQADIAAGMERFFKLHSMRAQTKDMFAHPDKFENPTNRNFVFELFSKLAEEDKVRIFEARVGEDLVACRLCFILGPTLYIYYSGYDPKWRDFSVGTLMMAKIIQWAIKNKFTEINLSAGKDRSKMQWRPAEHMFQGGVRISSNFRGGVASRYYSAVDSLRARRQVATP